MVTSSKKRGQSKRKKKTCKKKYWRRLKRGKIIGRKRAGRNRGRRVPGFPQ